MWPGKKGTPRGPRKPLELNRMVGIDFERLRRFSYAIVTLIGQDGYPWGVATEFEVSPGREILLKKPAAKTSLTGKTVGVLFNHIAAIPTGGYTERRYMLVWGKLTEQDARLKLIPEAVSEWDEKILPFDQLCARAAPQGQKYLAGLQRQIEA